MPDTELGVERPAAPIEADAEEALDTAARETRATVVRETVLSQEHTVTAEVLDEHSVVQEVATDLPEGGLGTGPLADYEGPDLHRLFGPHAASAPR